MYERVRLFKSMEIFSDINEEALELIAGIVSERQLMSGEALFKQGTPRVAVYAILSGQIELIRETEGTRVQLIIRGAGQVLGESALLHDAKHSTTARALTQVSLLVIPRDELISKLSQDPNNLLNLVTQVALTMTRRLQYASARQVGIDKVYRTGATRTEKDLLGARNVAKDALYGIQTLRAMENFSITGVTLSHYPTFVKSLAIIKQAAARINLRLRLLEEDIANAIDRACQEIIDGNFLGHFVVDMIQGGAGTSANMNANEVIANRALELLGYERGDYVQCHPNNHVNLSQSTNDVYPSAIRLAALKLVQKLITALENLAIEMDNKGRQFVDVIKMGRTQLQDAVPMTLGQEFSAWAVTIREDIHLLRETSRLFLSLNMGGTAIGTSINADPRYPQMVVEELRKITNLDISLSENLVEATPDTGSFVIFSGALKRNAVKISKLCNDLRLLSSGPRCGLNEINLPPMQPGSSIMPGKVNPVIPEVVNQVAFQIIGNDLTITMAAEAGQLQLNVMEPIIAFNLFQSIEMLAESVNTLSARCIRGITANKNHCREMVERSIGIITAVVPRLGYENASEIAKEALETGIPVREIILKKGYLNADEIEDLLSPEAMTKPRPIKRI